VHRQGWFDNNNYNAMYFSYVLLNTEQGVQVSDTTEAWQGYKSLLYNSSIPYLCTLSAKKEEQVKFY